MIMRQSMKKGDRLLFRGIRGSSGKWGRSKAVEKRKVACPLFPVPGQRKVACPLFLAILLIIAGCGEPMFENAGSQHSLIEDREACVMEIDQSPAALAYREDPTAHQDYPNQVFEEMNRCIERKGWKQVRSQEEQEQLSNAIASEASHSTPPASMSGSQSTEFFVKAVEERLARGPGEMR
jgi:hypothetical protein